jgi:hypothetical protein
VKAGRAYVHCTLRYLSGRIPIIVAMSSVLVTAGLAVWMAMAAPSLAGAVGFGLSVAVAVMDGHRYRISCSRRLPVRLDGSSSAS